MQEPNFPIKLGTFLSNLPILYQVNLNLGTKFSFKYSQSNPLAIENWKQTENQKVSHCESQTTKQVLPLPELIPTTTTIKRISNLNT